MENLLERVDKALDRVRPFLQDDGGDVRVVEISPNNEVIVELLGACTNCPFNEQTLTLGIEQVVCKEVPEIHCVKALDARCCS